MTETSSTTIAARLAAAGVPQDQVDLALKTSADLRALIKDLPEDTKGFRLRDIYESEIPS